MTSYSPNYKQLVIVEQGCMSCSAFWDSARHRWLRPVCSLKIEDYKVGKVRSMFVLAAKYQQFVSLVQRGGVTYPKSIGEDLEGPERRRTHSDPWNVSIVIDQAPLVADQIQLQHMIVDLVGILVKAAKSIDLVVTTVGDRSIDQTGRPLTQSPGHLGLVAIRAQASLHGRIGHEKCVV